MSAPGHDQRVRCPVGGLLVANHPERERKGMCTRKREEAEERRDGVSVLKREEAEGRKRMQCERGRRTLREREKLAAQAGIPGDNLSTLTT